MNHVASFVLHSHWAINISHCVHPLFVLEEPHQFDETPTAWHGMYHAYNSATHGPVYGQCICLVAAAQYPTSAGRHGDLDAQQGTPERQCYGVCPMADLTRPRAAPEPALAKVQTVSRLDSYLETDLSQESDVVCQTMKIAFCTLYPRALDCSQSLTWLAILLYVLSMTKLKAPD